MENNKDYQYYLSKYSIGRHKLSENSFVDVNNRNIIFSNIVQIIKDNGIDLMALLGFHQKINSMLNGLLMINK